jgi:hypothetical protein
VRDGVGPALPGARHFRARIQSFQAFAMTFPTVPQPPDRAARCASDGPADERRPPRPGRAEFVGPCHFRARIQSFQAFAMTFPAPTLHRTPASLPRRHRRSHARRPEGIPGQAAWAKAAPELGASPRSSLTTALAAVPAAPMSVAPIKSMITPTLEVLQANVHEMFLSVHSRRVS